MSDKTGDVKENLDSKVNEKEENRNIKSIQKNENYSRYQNNDTSLALRHNVKLFSSIYNGDDELSIKTSDSITDLFSMDDNYPEPTSIVCSSTSNIKTTDDVLLIKDEVNETITSSDNNVLTKIGNKSYPLEDSENSFLSTQKHYINHFKTVNSFNVSTVGQTYGNGKIESRNNGISSQNKKAIDDLNSMIAMEYANNELPMTMANYRPAGCNQNKINNFKKGSEYYNSNVCLSDRLSNFTENGDTFSDSETNEEDNLVRWIENRELSAAKIGMILSFLDSPHCIPPNIELNPNTGMPLPQKRSNKNNHPIDCNASEVGGQTKISLSGSFQHYHYPMKLGPNSQYSFSKNCKLNLDIPKTPEDEKKVFEVLIVDGKGVTREKFNVIYAGLPFKTICLGPSQSYNPFQNHAIESETGERYYIDSMDDSMFSGDVDISIDKNYNVNIKKACNCICRFHCSIYDSKIESEDYFYFFERSNVRIFNKERFDKILPGILDYAKLNNWNISMLKKYATVTISFVDSREPDCKDISRIGVDKDSLPCYHKGSYMEIVILPIIDIINEKYMKICSQSLCC
uniref:FHA domain-containing protein n=1 Tax=Strongyloides venezuelensis TaxID=75913 RepID=A0A0K0FH53_STRVS